MPEADAAPSSEWAKGAAEAKATIATTITAVAAEADAVVVVSDGRITTSRSETGTRP